MTHQSETVLFTSPYFTLDKVADGVYAAIVVEGAGALGNAGFVDLGESVLVFDTFLTPQAAEDLRRAVEVLVGKPVAYVVNSHYHGDHVNGNQVFEGSVILSTGKTRGLIMQGAPTEDLATMQKQFTANLDEMEKSALAEPDERRRQDMLLDISDKRVLCANLLTLRHTPPTMTFEDRLEIHGSRRRVELLSFGGGHSDSDAFLYLPDEQMAFMADLVLVNTTPFAGVGHPEHWLTILDRVKELNLLTIIPGHGPVGTAEHIGHTADYLRFLLTQIREAKQSNHTVDEAVSWALPVPYRQWAATMIHEWNLSRLWDRV